MAVRFNFSYEKGLKTLLQNGQESFCRNPNPLDYRITGEITGAKSSRLLFSCSPALIHVDDFTWINLGKFPLIYFKESAAMHVKLILCFMPATDNRVS